MAEEHVLNAVVAQHARVEEFHLVVNVGHNFGVAQDIGQRSLVHGPSVGVGVNGILVGSAEEEGFGLFPVCASRAPLVAGGVEGGLATGNDVGIHRVVVGTCYLQSPSTEAEEEGQAAAFQFLDYVHLGYYRLLE